MNYFIQSGSDGSFLEQILDPSSIIPTLVHGDEVFKTMAQMQKMTDSNAQTRYGVKQAGYYTNPDGSKEGGLKVIARLPQSVAIALLAVEPDLFKDAKTFKRILKKYPIYKAYSTGAKE